MKFSNLQVIFVENLKKILNKFWEKKNTEKNGPNRSGPVRTDRTPKKIGLFGGPRTKDGPSKFGKRSDGPKTDRRGDGSDRTGPDRPNTN